MTPFIEIRKMSLSSILRSAMDVKISNIIQLCEKNMATSFAFLSFGSGGVKIVKVKCNHGNTAITWVILWWNAKNVALLSHFNQVIVCGRNVAR